MHWHSIHVAYYDDHKEALVLHGVRPVFRRLADAVDASYFTRHWRRGPHLRLNFRTGNDVFADVVRPRINQVVGGFLAERPSVSKLDPLHQMPLHRRLAELEHDRGALLPWYPDNSIHVASYERRIDVLGSVEAAGLLADFYVRTTELTFAMSEAIAGKAQRLAIAFDLMIATAHALSSIGLATGFVSFRSHAEAFLHGFAEGERLRPRWDEAHRRNARTLADRVQAVVATLDGERNAAAFVSDWVAAVTPCRERAAELIAAGLIDMDAGSAAGDTGGFRYSVSSSPFHRELFANPAWQEGKSAEWFSLYRLMLNYTYLQLTRIGVTPVERFMLCHLAADTVEDLHGVTAFDLIKRSTAAVPNLPHGR